MIEPINKREKAIKNGETTPAEILVKIANVDQIKPRNIRMTRLLFLFINLYRRAEFSLFKANPTADLTAFGEVFGESDLAL